MENTTNAAEVFLAELTEKRLAVEKEVKAMMDTFEKETGCILILDRKAEGVRFFAVINADLIP